MAGTKNHDYHILPPDIWPFVGAMGAFVLAIGAVSSLLGAKLMVCARKGKGKPA